MVGYAQPGRLATGADSRPLQGLPEGVREVVAAVFLDEVVSHDQAGGHLEPNNKLWAVGLTLHDVRGQGHLAANPFDFLVGAPGRAALTPLRVDHRREPCLPAREASRVTVDGSRQSNERPNLLRIGGYQRPVQARSAAQPRDTPQTRYARA